MLQLVPAPPPPPEYCFLWADRWWPWADPWWLCMQKAEWSGWAQAIGALVALAIAIALPALARRQARQDAKEMIVAFIAQVSVALEEAGESCAEKDWQKFQAKRLLLQDAAQAGDFLLNAPINGEIRGRALGVRSTVLDAFHLSETHTSHGNWAQWQGTFQGCAAAASMLLGEIRRLRP